MARVVSGDVTPLIRDYDTTVSMTQFITMAHNLTNKVAAKDTSAELSALDLIDIENCLARHFYETRDHGLESESTEGASGKYTGQFGQGLRRTRAGQNALMLDTTGYLRKLSDGVPKAGMTWLGKVPSDQTNYTDRD